MMERTEFWFFYFVFNSLLCTQCVSVWAHMGQSVCVEVRGQLQVLVLTSFLETKISLFCCDAKIAGLQTSSDSPVSAFHLTAGALRLQVFTL